LAGAPDAIFITESESGRIVEANEAAARLLETTVEDIVGRHQSELHPPEQTEQYRSFFQTHQQMARNGNTVFSTLEDGTQMCVVTDMGETVPVEINASFVDMNGDELFVGIFRNITERLRREEQLRAAKEEAEVASAFKSAMLRNMSHEIRTPITSIIGFSKLLTDSLEGTAQEHAENIHEAGQHLMKTIDSVLELSKLETGVHDLERETARLDQAVRWNAELLGLQAEEHGVTLETDLPASPIEGHWNQEALHQITQHLLENAIKFTPEGGVVELRAWQDVDEAVLEVEDTGIGMNPDEVSTLLEPFRQASEGLTREFEGVGLGLPIVRELTDALGGTVEVQTEKGEGSCFTVRLPFRGHEASGDDRD